MTKWQDTKKWWRKNKEKALPWFNLGRDVISSAANLPEDPTIVHYIDLALLCKDSYQEIFEGRKIRLLAKGDGRKLYSLSDLNIWLVEKLWELRNDHIINLGEDEVEAAYLLKLKDTSVTWIQGKNGLSFFIEADKEEEAQQELSDLVMESFTNHKIVVKYKGSYLTVEEDRSSESFIDFKKCHEMMEYLDKFWLKNINRSLLFYGPPGSGKSNLIRGIIQKHKARTIKFVNLMDIDVNSMLEIITFFKPDCVVLEDIDHMSNDDINFLLERIEQFNKTVRLVLASANNTYRLDNALLRPGRFDEAIEIKYLDEDVLIKLLPLHEGKQDLELFEMVKHFPIAYTQEVLKRIAALGREDALKTIKDIEIRVKNLIVDNYSLNKLDDDEEEYLEEASNPYAEIFEEEEEDDEE